MNDVVERALKALRDAGFGTQQTEASAQAATVLITLEPERKERALERTDQIKNRTGCPGPEHCGGCYAISGGRYIHPPRISHEVKEWFERWKPQGKVQ
ncbi:MAG: hypothetical protein HYX72_12925 [Acidobacteria bacterium]|nr:hypothetical protein [Acidobacteriota bacterium]